MLAAKEAFAAALELETMAGGGNLTEPKRPLRSSKERSTASTLCWRRLLAKRFDETEWERWSKALGQGSLLGARRRHCQPSRSNVGLGSLL